MIKVITGKYNNLEYDVRGIAMSFFPGVGIEFYSELAEANCIENSSCPKGEILKVAKSDEDIILNLENIIDDDCASKNDMRKSIYEYLRKLTGRELPWGILIGIRPTKLALSKLSTGASIPETAKYFQEEYKVTPSKSVLASTIAAREIKIVNDYRNALNRDNLIRMGDDNQSRMGDDNQSRMGDDNLFALYAGVPFCPSRCLYCSFASQPIELWRDKTDTYVDAALYELTSSMQLMKETGRKCTSIYVGGGTPTSLPDKQFERFISGIARFYDEARGRERGMEFTVEAGRPDSISERKLDIMRDVGVNRISINPQTMNDDTLVRIGRNHSVRDIIKTFELARAKGFDNINMDIILGLPGENTRHVTRTIEQIAHLQPESVTVHSLAVKRAARLNIDADGVVMPGPDAAVCEEMMEIARLGALKMGLNPYYMYRQKNMAGNLENVGFAAPGKECYYNIVMMEELESICAIGAGTVSKIVRSTQIDDAAKCDDATENAAQENDAKCDGAQAERISRCDCHKDPKLYIEQIEKMIDRKRELFT